MDETLLKAEDLKNVRMAAWLSKRSSSFPHGWAQRYVVLSANLLYIYTQPLDAKPKRVVLVDDATATVRGGGWPRPRCRERPPVHDGIVRNRMHARPCLLIGAGGRWLLAQAARLQDNDARGEGVRLRGGDRGGP
jgi:hypothetical protein